MSLDRRQGSGEETQGMGVGKGGEGVERQRPEHKSAGDQELWDK